MSYTKHEFKSGEKLFASQLNEMDEQIRKNSEALESGTKFKTDETLSLADGVLSVNRASELEPDNTLPITAAAVDAAVKSIEIILDQNTQTLLGIQNDVSELQNSTKTESEYMIPDPVDRSVYEGKKIACVGDSVTAGVGANSNPYVTQLGTALGTTMINLGASGTVLCTGGHRGCNINKLTEANLKSADIVTIMMGVNDWDQAVKDGYFGGKLSYDASNTYYTLGDIDSEDTTTIYGALKMWCDRIMELRQTESLSHTKFYFMTPPITSWNNSVSSTKNWDQNKVNIHGYKFRDLCKAIIDVCALYKIPVIDLNLYSGIYYKSADDNNVSTYGGDGIHPNESGHVLLADAIIRALEQNPEYKSSTESLYYILDYVSKVLGTELSYPASVGETVEVPLESITLSVSELSLEAGGTHTVTAALEPTNTTQTNLIWESSNTTVATVKNGVITAIAAGNATVTCKSADNSAISATIALSVTASESTDLTALVMSAEAVTVEAGKTHTMTVAYVPATTEQTGVEWESDDNDVATVAPSADGKSCIITAVNEGQCYITVKSTVNSNISDSCLFTTTGAGENAGENTVFDVILNSNATYDSLTGVIGGTSTATTSLISDSNAIALVNEPISNGMEIEVEAISKDGLAFADANKSKWSVAMLGLTRANAIDDIATNPFSKPFPVGDANIYLDQPGSSQAYQVQYMRQSHALGKDGLGIYYPYGDAVMAVKVIFRKNVDGTVSVKIGDNNWFDYSNNATVAAITEYKAAVNANTLYFFASGMGLTQFKINYIGEIR